nr:apolipophorins-like [Pogona vitticeps]
MPEGKPTLYVTSLTNYLIEEKLMKPFRRLYNINLMAEYYRAKQALMETPFEYHALLMGYKHLRTFDGEMYSLTSKCSVLLAKDFIHDTFALILNLNSSGVKSLHAYLSDTTVVIHPEQKIYSKYNSSQWDSSCHPDIPLEENDIVVQREADHVGISTTSGASFSCDLRYDLCTLTLDGWHHATSAGLLGTNDNEAGNEWMLPNHSYADSLEEFIGAWQVSDHCSQAKNAEKLCVNTSGSKICKTFFQDFNSPFRNCFRVVDPEPFHSLCVSHTCELPNIKTPCTMAAAFVHLCNRNFVPLEMPFQCDGELRLRNSSLPKATH